jgi:hypothetical protein
LDGDPVDRYLRVVRVHIDALSESLDEALTTVPPEHREAVRARWQSERDQPIRRANVLTGSGGPRSWSTEWDASKGYCWLRLRQFLIDRKEWGEVDVLSLDDMSNRVLAHIEDPRPTGPQSFRVQGLVLGYVQSGKTANITALIAKCADLGYKLFIVLSGMDDGLRKQTQERLGLELGLVDDPEGVGLPVPGQRWVSLTRNELKGDFNPGTVEPAAILQGNDRVIAVVKKNANILRKFLRWMEDAPPPANLPVLVIDDEADQASVNTADPDLDPSAINRLIRDLIARFHRVSYVAYTATPFANVLIDPDANDPAVQADLYPRDFIIALPRPPRYLGAERLFGRDAMDHEDDEVAGLDVIRIIPDGEVGTVVPDAGARDGFSPAMPATLQLAFLDFILGSAAKMERLGDGICTMLIHTSHLTYLHNSLGGLVNEHLARLRGQWLYDRDELRAALLARWEEEFRPVIVSLDAAKDRAFEQIEPCVTEFFSGRPELKVLNVTSPDVLDYRANPKAKLVLIGGNRLSRGLTLVDLVCSYYVRHAHNYDTLLQMGRWFGYREKYVDLTRLWTTEELAERFRHLALVEEELRDEIAVYERAKLTPREFGPKIRTHPAMAITAANKMRHAYTVRLSFAGQLRQTSRFHLTDQQWLQSNLDATRRFLRSLGASNANDEKGRPGWTGVPWHRVDEFLSQYQSAQTPDSFDSLTLARYIKAQAEGHRELVRWRVSVRELGERDNALKTEDLGIQGRTAVNCISRSRLKSDRDSVGVLTNPAQREENGVGDEEIGLTEEKMTRARDEYRKGEYRKLGSALRAQRDRQEGLLLLYPVSRFSKGTTSERHNLFDDTDRGCTVVGVAIVFPASESAATVEYSAGPARPQLTDDDDAE